MYNLDLTLATQFVLLKDVPCLVWCCSPTSGRVLTALESRWLVSEIMECKSADTSLPLVSYGLLAQLLPWSELQAARLACKQFAEAIDPRIATINVRTWEQVHPTVRLQHVTALHAVIQTPSDWQQMQQLCQLLPRLQIMFLQGRRTWQQLSNNSSLSSSLLPLSSIRAISFQGIVKGLDDIAALAPNLQHLYCAKLILLEPHSVHLPTVTHFGSTQVQVEAEEPEEAGQIFASAFPRLCVVFETPMYTFNPVRAFGFQNIDPMSLRQAIMHCTSLHSLRIFGDATTMYGMLPGQLQQLQQIKRLSVYGVGPPAELKGISKLTQLQHLTLTFQLPAKKAVTQLLQELLQLPQLRSLSLPAKLLCSRCCSSMQQYVHQIAGKPGITELTFLKRPANSARRKQSGDYCQHTENLVEAYQQIVTASAAAAAPDVDDAGSSQVSIQLLEMLPGTAVGTHGLNRLDATASGSDVVHNSSQNRSYRSSSAGGRLDWGMLGPCGL